MGKGKEFWAEITQLKQPEIADLYRRKKAGRLAPSWEEPRVNFTKTLENKIKEHSLALVWETHGLHLSDFSRQFDEYISSMGGAGPLASLSIVTEKLMAQGDISLLADFWQAKVSDLSLPLWRKDFIIDSIQLLETAGTPASAVLLMAALAQDKFRLRDWLQEAEFLKLAAPIEIGDEWELDLAREAGAKVIQVNTRNWGELTVDVNRSLELALKHAADENEIWVLTGCGCDPGLLLSASKVGFEALVFGGQSDSPLDLWNKFKILQEEFRMAKEALIY